MKKIVFYIGLLGTISTTIVCMDTYTTIEDLATALFEKAQGTVPAYKIQVTRGGLGHTPDPLGRLRDFNRTFNLGFDTAINAFQATPAGLSMTVQGLAKKIFIHETTKQTQDHWRDMNRAMNLFGAKTTDVERLQVLSDFNKAYLLGFDNEILAAQTRCLRAAPVTPPAPTALPNLAQLKRDLNGLANTVYNAGKSVASDIQRERFLEKINPKLPLATVLKAIAKFNRRHNLSYYPEIDIMRQQLGAPDEILSEDSETGSGPDDDTPPDLNGDRLGLRYTVTRFIQTPMGKIIGLAGIGIACLVAYFKLKAAKAPHDTVDETEQNTVEHIEAPL